MYKETKILICSIHSIFYSEEFPIFIPCGTKFNVFFDFRTRGRVSGVGSNRDQRDDVDRVDTRFTQSEFHHVLKKFT